MKRNTVTGNMNRAEARRAENANRKTRFQPDSTASATASGACPVRLNAVGNDEALRTTWMECLSSVRAQLEEARFGMEAAHRLEAASIMLCLAARVLETTAVGFPCCEKAKQPHKEMDQFGKDLRQLGIETAALIEVAEGRQGAGEVFSRLTSILHRLPRPEHIVEIAVDVRVPWCTCATCIWSYMYGGRILSCRYCPTIMKWKMRKQ